MRYFIIGFKNSGKTTFGRQLAKRLQLDFIDLDEFIERKEQRGIPEIYSRLGEDKFRKLEWKALQEVVHETDIVISTGGGAPCHCDNMTLMESYGDVVYLKVSDNTLVDRLKLATGDRPIVKGKTTEELRQYVTALREKCEHLYLRAKYIVDGDNLDMESVIKSLAGLSER